MRLIYIFRTMLLVGAALLMTQGPLYASEKNQILLIENVTAIDARNGAKENVTVLIKDTKILAVERDIRTLLRRQGRASVKRIDGRGKYLIPGLWDAHVHLTYKPGLDYRSFFPLSIAFGVTSLRDIGGHLDLLKDARERAAADQMAPNLYVSGPLIDGGARVYDGHSTSFPNLSVGATTPGEAVKIVDDLAAQGVDFLKAYEMLSPETFSAIIERAKMHNLAVAAHTPLSLTPLQAIEAGASDFQHLRNLEFGCARNSQQLLAERQRILAASADQQGSKTRSEIHTAQKQRALAEQDTAKCGALIKAMKKHGVYQTPTLTITTFLTAKLYAQQRWTDTFRFAPPKIAESWHNSASSLAKREPTKDDRIFYDWVMAMVAQLDAAGVPIMAGTDAPIGFLTPGASLHEELALLVEAGLDPIDAIRAATLTPASFLGLDDRVGTIESGMVADLVLLNANPLDDIRNTLSIETVIKNGHIIDKQKIDELKAQPSLLKD